MILNRMRARFRSQDWFGVGLELLIVVLGVFLGIQASNWNEARIEHETGRAYRMRLDADLDANARDLGIRAKYYRQVKSHALAARSALQRPPGEVGERFLIDLYEASQLIPRSMKRNTWDEILSTGAMNLVGSPEQREKISNYYLSVETIEFTLKAVPPYRAYIRSRMPYDIQALVRARCPEQVTIDERFNVTSRLAEHCTLGLPADRAAAVAARLRADPELEGHLNALLTDLDTKIVLTDSFRQVTGTLRQAWPKG